MTSIAEDYIILEGNDSGGMERTVNNLMAQGYQLQGSVSVVRCTETFWYTQAMVKRFSLFERFSRWMARK